MLDDLRKKSPLLKEVYAFWGALLLTSLIGLIWLVVQYINLSQNDSFYELEEGRQRAGAFAQFFGQMKENISNTWQENKEIINELSTEGLEENTAPSDDTNATSTATTTPSTNTTTYEVQIGTSSKKDIKIATSSKQID